MNVLASTTVARDWIDCATLAFSGSLVVVGIAGICIALRTLKVIEKQTEQLVKSADAALLNAKALINSERP